jgi:2-polyprenyl-6-methoxyphenol hydroxylase-like FAD-dependent oxidoreductase
MSKDTRESVTAESVLIVGAGPVGLTVALELVRFGVPVRIIDKAPAASTTSKALAVWPRTLEMLAASGVTDDLIAAGVRARGNRIFHGDRVLVELNFDTIASAYPFVLFVTQDQTERILTEHLERLGVTIDRGVELTSVLQDEDGISAVLLHGAGTIEATKTAWLIGCDGAHSFIRHALGKSFDGTTNPSDFILADLYLAGEHPFSHSAMSMFAHHNGMLAIFPIGKERFRIIADLGRATEEHRATPTLADVQGILDERGPGGLTAHDPVWLSPFRINERQVSSYRTARMFLAGDAAHVHSPAGGQGMNTGIQDACNLAWKLALVVRGEASGDVLLESYDAERHPIAKHVIAQTATLTSVMTLKNQIGQSIRNVVLHALFGIPAVEHAAENVLSEITIGYPKSVLSSTAPDAFIAPKAGARVPPQDTDVTAGKNDAPRFTVFARNDAEARAFVTDHRTIVDPVIRTPFNPDGLWLVRPDGYVGHVARAGDWKSAREYLGSIGCVQAALVR